MKKIKIMLIVLSITALCANAQKDSAKFFQTIKAGIIVGASASTDFQNSATPFAFGCGLLANVTIVTPKTYHNLMYGFGDNSIRFLSGYLLPRNWDTYLVYSKVLSMNKHYLGLGLEKMIKAGDVKCFLFSEIGSDFKGTETLSIGVLISVQTLFYKRN